MEMCYSGALVMPSSYAVMDEEEMTYLQGGFSDTIFRNNLKGAYRNCAMAANALKMGGLTWGVICKTAFSSVSYIAAVYGSTINTVALCIGGIVAEIIAALAFVAAVDYVGSHRIWY